MEKIISIVPNLRKRKLLGFSNETYTIIIFENETVLAKLTSKIMKENAAKAKEKAKSEGKGFFGRWGAQLASSLNYSERYRNMSISDIKNETPGNLSFDNDTITKIKIRMNDQSQESGRIFYNIDFYASGEKYKFTTEQDVETEFKKAFGNKVK